MKKRIDLFLQLGSYAAVARIEGVDTSTIRKQMLSIKNERVQELIARKNKKYIQCWGCFREKVWAKGLCGACYKYFNYIPTGKRMGRRLNSA